MSDITKEMYFKMDEELSKLYDIAYREGFNRDHELEKKNEAVFKSHKIIFSIFSKEPYDE